MVIDYDRAAADYEASLVTKLRGHGAGSFLENWVPDPDPALGIFNMIEAAWTGARERLELVVSAATLGDAGLERLKELAAPIADIRATSSAEAHRLEIVRIAGRAAAKAAKKEVKIRARADQPRAEATAVPPLHPMLEDALQAETAHFTHQAKTGSGISLEVGADGIIRTARHREVKPELRCKLVELMCREIEGRTPQDASDHAAVLVIHRLRQRGGARPAAGILLPANAGTEVLAALELVRNACRERLGNQRKANFFELGPTPAWRALSLAEKLQRVSSATDQFCDAEGATAKAVRIDKDIHGHEIRVIVQMDGVLEPDGVPFFLRRLERLLKDRVEQALQVYLEPLKDKNVLRRL